MQFKRTKNKNNIIHFDIHGLVNSASFDYFIIVEFVYALTLN